jgi:hypothetical protein
MIAFLRNWVFKDFWLKLFSFALATLIWFTISFAINKEGPSVPANSALGIIAHEERTFSNLPVTVTSSAEDVRNFRVAPKEGEVTLQGDPKALAKLQSHDIRLIVDLTGIGAAHDLRKRIDVSAPLGLTVVHVDPPEVQVIFPSPN